jgi:hypothetical protein
MNNHSQIDRNDHVFRSPFSNQTSRAAAILAALCLLVCFISGCAATRLRVDYKGYENVYAESSNRQLLLNLARLNQHHPTYFFKLGPISTYYKMQGTLAGNASQVNGLYTNPLNKTISGGGSTGLSYEQDPTFSFIPVNDDTVAKQLLQPIQSEHFYVLFQQGWRLDQLMRLMVDRIEFQQPGSQSIQVIRNTPSADNVEGYLTFLRISALAFELQRRGHLMVSGKSHFQPLMADLEMKTGPEAKDIADAQSKGLLWKQDGNKWTLGQNVVEPEFHLNFPDMRDSERICHTDRPEDKPKTPDDLLICEIGKDEDVSILTKAKSLRLTLNILKIGFNITGGTPTQDPADQLQNGSAHFVMRSLIGAMASASQEQNVFDALLKKAETLTPAQDKIPAAELRPLLTLTWNDEGTLTPSLVELSYLGKSYRVADEKSDDPLSQSSWNRDMFRIIAQLSSQVTVDISKFPLPTVLQLRQD